MLNENVINQLLADKLKKNIFLINSLKLEKDLKSKNQHIKEIYIEKELPDGLIVSVVEYLPIIKAKSSENCLLWDFENKKLVTEFTVCENYKIPELINKASTDLDYIVPYIIYIQNMFNKYSETIEPPSKYIVTDYLTVVFNEHLVFIDQFKNLKQAFFMYYNLKKRIKFRELDLRFDRAVFK